MDGIVIRAPREEEFHTLFGVSCLAFGEEPNQEDEDAYRLSFPFDRALCAYEEGRMVATSAVLPLELTLPGETSLPLGGVTWIATLPTHRRRGLLRRLMEVQLADMVSRDEPLSALLASEGSIYGHFGYGPATSIMSFRVERPYAMFASESVDSGRITVLGSEEAAAELPSIYEDLRLHRPGTVSRPSMWWPHYLHDPVIERQGAGSMYHAKHETATGGADGYVSYRLKESWEASTPQGEIMVVELLAMDPDTYKALWRYVLDTDLCRWTSCWRGRVDEPLRWLLADPRRFEVKALADDLYLRLLDVPRALAARTYAAEGELVLQVNSSFPVSRTERVLLNTAMVPEPAAECARSHRDPDLVLDVEYLGAAYLGGVSFALLAAAGRVEEATPGAVALADRMFATALSPYCSTMF